MWEAEALPEHGDGAEIDAPPASAAGTPAANDRLRFLLSAAPVMLYARRPAADFALTYLSDNVAAHFGYPAQRFVEDEGFWAARVHPDDLARVRQSLATLVDTGHGLNEYRLLHRDGSVRWVFDEGRLIPGVHGEAAEITGYWIDITERKRTGQALLESEQRFALFMKYLPGVAFIKDAAGRYLYLSEKSRNVYQRDPAELVGKTDEELWPPDTAAQFRAHDQVVLALGGQLQTIETAPQQDGLHHWLVSKFAIPDAQGRSEWTAGIGIDITEQTRAEAALRESERFARATIDSLSANLCVLDEEGRIVATNKAWREFAAANGAPPEKVGEGADYLAVCDAASLSIPFAADFAAGIRAVLGGMRDQYAAQYDCHSPTRQRWFAARVTRFPGEGPVRAVIVHENITQRTLAEMALRRSEQRLDSILASLDDVVWSLSPDTYELLYLNPAAERLYGYPVRDFFAHRNLWLDVIHADDRERVVANLPEFLKRGACELEYRVVRPDGSVRWVRDRGQVIHDDAGRVVRLDGIVTDVTELSRAQDALRENTSRLQRLTAHLESVREEQSARIAREVHDELGGTLTVMRLGLASVLQKTAESPQVREKLESMVKLSDAAIQTVKRISSALRPSMLDNLGLVATVRWLAGEFSRLTGIEAELRLPQHVRLSKERKIAVYRIIQEALTNVARHSEATKVAIRFRKQKGDLIVDIADNGRGASESNLNRPDSYGILGMRERTQYLGGEIGIRSVARKGTKLSLRVPMDQVEGS